MEKESIITFEHFMAMYYCNNNEKPSQFTLSKFSSYYRTMEDQEAVNDLLRDLALIKTEVYDNDLYDTLKRYGFGISINEFRLLIDPLISALNE
ncbi:hypothetical protein BRE01_62890 [Brevibacillus reuszeri]|uniref:CdiI immunity protein domain-containing protein n=1 Tax=Brevibacillus reuszeri TaxID=54915 RepID=A0A0K9YWA9_9BACL|nr:hypothetical protein [Brevibacillus reuszeri]KNB72968.1 hypothetical protein ADS79_14200 [Brevibacillus reuszeri]GED72587.1 hypothetical protein BRE01_62890 [Brevibacillus reuszeri]